MTASELIVAPSTEPLTLTEAKSYLRVETTADDAVITSLITAARQWAEQFTGRVFITQTWRLWLDQWPCGNTQWWDGMREAAVSALASKNDVALPKAGVQSVSSITLFADDDSSSLWPSNNYYVDTASQPARIVPRNSALWPQPTRSANGIRIDYVAGYGSAAAVPETIKTALKQLIAFWYEHRGDNSTLPPPAAVCALLLPYRLQGFTL